MSLYGPGSIKVRKARDAALKRIRKRKKPFPWQDASKSRLQRVCLFIESCPVTKGILRGRPVELLPDQVAFLADIYDRPADRPVRLAVKSAPRGNGKTGL